MLGCSKMPDVGGKQTTQDAKRDFPNPERDTVIIAWNQKSGRKSREVAVEGLLEKLRIAGLHVFVENDLNTIKQRVFESRQSGRLRAVVSAGGDGTIRLLADELGEGVPFAVFPLGSENLLAKHLGISGSPDGTASSILKQNLTSLDAARANGKLFLIVLSCGFDAEVVELTHQNRKGHIRRRNYATSVFQIIQRYRYPPLKISVDGIELQQRPSWAFVFNVPRYAMDLAIAPEAKSNDGLLDLCTFEKGGLAKGLWYFLSVLLRRKRRSTESHHFLGKSIEINSDSTVAFQIDGDPGGKLPVLIETLPRYLTVFVPILS
ncbi:MAG: diacylglycerol kinase family protein [Pirellulaceae bacterium]